MSMPGRGSAFSVMLMLAMTLFPAHSAPYRVSDNSQMETEGDRLTGASVVGMVTPNPMKG